MNSYLQLKCLNNKTENSINLKAGFGRNDYANSVLFENGYYSINFVVYTAEEIVGGELYVDEEEVGTLELLKREEDRYEFKIIYKGSNEKDRGYPFLMMIDSVRLRVHLYLEDESDIYYSSDRVLVTTKSLDDQKNVDEMIYYIAGKNGLSRQIDTSYEEDTITLGLFNNHILNIINLYEKHRTLYERQYNRSEDLSSARRKIFMSDFIGGNTLSNPKIERERMEIMEFLYDLLLASKRLFQSIKDITKDMEIKYRRLKNSLPAGYSAPIIITYRLRIDRVYIELKRLETFMVMIKNILLRNKFKPQGKFVLKSKIDDYVNPIFWLYMNRWTNSRSVNLRYHEFFFNIDSLDKLFEYYCLARILNCTKQMNFRHADIKDKQFFYPTTNNVFQNESTIFNTFYREKDGVLLTIYFQPLIYRGKVLNDLDLIRTTGVGDSFTNFNKTGNYYSPDFILKFEGKETKYLILDAKYQTRNTILRGHMDQVISKYFNQVKNINGKRNQMVYVLQGRVDENTNDTWFYENVEGDMIENFYSDFGIFQYSPDQVRNFSFAKLIEKMINEVK